MNRFTAKIKKELLKRTARSLKRTAGFLGMSIIISVFDADDWKIFTSACGNRQELMMCIEAELNSISVNSAKSREDILNEIASMMQ